MEYRQLNSNANVRSIFHAIHPIRPEEMDAKHLLDTIAIHTPRAMQMWTNLGLLAQFAQDFAPADNPVKDKIVKITILRRKELLGLLERRAIDRSANALAKKITADYLVVKKLCRQLGTSIGSLELQTVSDLL